MSHPCTILLADPNSFLRERIAGILVRQDNIECVVQADAAEHMLTAARDHRPHLILVDLSLLQDRELVAHLKRCSPDSRLLVLVEVRTEPYVRAACDLCADGVLEKGRLLDAIQEQILAASP